MAGGPGGREVGRVTVKVAPDTSEVLPKTKAAVEQADREKIHLAIELDDERLREQLRRLASRTLRINAIVNIDVADAKAKIEALSSSVAKIKASVDTSGMREQIDATVSQTRARLNVDADLGKLRTDTLQAIQRAESSLPPIRIGAAATEAEQKVRDLRAELSDLSGDVRLGLDMGSVNERLAVLRRQLSQIDRETVDVEVKADVSSALAALAALDGAAKKTSRSMSGGGGGNFFGSGLIATRVVGITTAVGALIPTALSAANAVGVMAQGLAAAPAAGIALAGAVGVAKLAFGGLGDQLKQLEKTGQGSAALKGLAAQIKASQSAFNGLRASVQAAVLPAAAGLLRFATSAQVMQPVSAGVMAVARNMAESFRGLQAQLGGSDFFGNLRASMVSTAPVVRYVVDAVGALARSFVAFGAGAGSTLTSWAYRASAALQDLAGWAEAMAANGSVKRWAEQGGAAVASFVGSVLNIGAAIKNIAAAAPDGGSFLSGLERMSAGLKNLTGNADAQNAMTALFQGINTAVTNTAAVLAAFGPAIGATFSAVAAGLAPVGQALSQAGVAVGQFVSQVSQMSGFAPTVTALAAAFAAYRVVMVAVTVAQGIAAAATAAWTAAQTALNVVLSANPIGIVVMAIAALVAALVVAYQKSETFRAIVQGAWHGIQAAASAVSAWFTGSLVPMLAAAWAAIQAAVSAMGAWLSGVWSSIQGVASAAWSGIVAVVTAYVNVVRAVVTGVFNALRAVISGAVGFYRAVITAGFEVIRAVITAYVNGARAVATAAFNGIRAAITGAINAARAAVSAGMSAIKALIHGNLSGALAAARSFVGSFAGIGAAIIQGLVGGIRSMAASVASAARSVVSGAVKAAKSALSIHSPSRVAHSEIGEPFSSGIAVGILSGSSQVKSAATKVVKTAVAAASKVKATAVKLPVTYATPKLSTSGTEYATALNANLIAQTQYKNLAEKARYLNDVAAGQASRAKALIDQADKRTVRERAQADAARKAWQDASKAARAAGKSAADRDRLKKIAADKKAAYTRALNEARAASKAESAVRKSEKSKASAAKKAASEAKKRADDAQKRATDAQKEAAKKALEIPDMPDVMNPAGAGGFFVPGGTRGQRQLVFNGPVGLNPDDVAVAVNRADAAAVSVEMLGLAV